VANEKQRRRRAKEKRHEYDLVQIDDEGNETVLTASELRPNEPAKTKKGSTKSSGSGRGRGRGGRGAPQPASWTRVGRRGAIAAPLFFLMVMLLGGKNVTIASAALNTFFLLFLFVPFSYVLDGFVYRSYQKRLAKPKSR